MQARSQGGGSLDLSEPPSTNKLIFINQRVQASTSCHGAATRIKVQFCIQRSWCSSQSDYIMMNSVWVWQIQLETCKCTNKQPIMLAMQVINN